jgi:hypothetical protein
VSPEEEARTPGFAESSYKRGHEAFLQRLRADAALSKKLRSAKMWRGDPRYELARGAIEIFASAGRSAEIHSVREGGLVLFATLLLHFSVQGLPPALRRTRFGRPLKSMHFHLLPALRWRALLQGPRPRARRKIRR